MTSVETHDDEAEGLAQDLAGHSTVTDTHVNASRRPHRVMADVDRLPIPGGVQDILEQHQASIEQVEGGTDGILLTLCPTEPWQPAGQRTTRSHGGSIVCTLHPDAVAVSGLVDGVEVDLEAREGQVRITRRDGE